MHMVYVHAAVLLQLFAQNGGDCMVPPSVTMLEASELFPQHIVKDVPSGKKYMRVTPQP